MPAKSAEEEVLHAEQDLYRAMETRDPEAIGRMLAEDLVYVHSTAVAESKTEYLAGVAAGLYEYEMVKSHHTRVRIHGDVVFVDGVCDMRVGAKGEAATLIHLLFVLAWGRNGGTWRLVHRHAVRVPDKA